MSNNTGRKQYFEVKLFAEENENWSLDDNPQQVFERITSFSECAWCLHDKDDNAPHWHILIDLGAQHKKTLSALAKALNIPAAWINYIKKDMRTAFAYLIHDPAVCSDDSIKGKHQYDPSERHCTDGFKIPKAGDGASMMDQIDAIMQLSPASTVRERYNQCAEIGAVPAFLRYYHFNKDVLFEDKAQATIDHETWYKKCIERLENERAELVAAYSALIQYAYQEGMNTQQLAMYQLAADRVKGIVFTEISSVECEFYDD